MFTIHLLIRLETIIILNWMKKTSTLSRNNKSEIEHPHSEIKIHEDHYL